MSVGINCCGIEESVKMIFGKIMVGVLVVIRKVINSVIVGGYRRGVGLKL